MANKRISELTSITGANLADADLLVVVDVSDPTMAASGTNKKITMAELAKDSALTDNLIAKTTLTTDGDVLTRAAGAPARITRADLAADSAFSSRYGLSGTGSPEGVVTAAVGARYTDTAATTGAILWVKATGAGNTGWVVAYGDTGWRTVTKADLGNPANIAGLTSGTSFSVRMRRENDLVTIRIQQLTMESGWTTSDISDNRITLPTGFTCSSLMSDTLSVVGRNGTNGALVFLNFGGATVRPAYGISATQALGATFVTFMTSDAWPASLPGTASV